MAEWDEALPLERRLIHVAATMACHGSVRAGDTLHPDECSALLRDLDAIDFAGYCPHGRPIVTVLPYVELEKKVGDAAHTARRSPDRLRARSSAAPTKPRNSGAERVGRDLNSGWNWLATNHG